MNTLPDLVTLLGSIVLVLGAVTALVVQIQRLVTLSEAYMVELKRTNAATETASAAALQLAQTVAIVGKEKGPNS